MAIRLRHLLSASLAAVLALACGTDEVHRPAPELLVYGIHPIGDDRFSGTAGKELPSVPTVRITDLFKGPVEGAHVTFTVTGGGGFAKKASVVTDANGIATGGGWTLGKVAGLNTMTVGVGNVVYEFSAIGLPGPLVSLAKIAGDSQNVAQGSAVVRAPSVKAIDEYGNGIAGVAVTFAVASGGGSISGATQTTDSSGIATVKSWTLGAAAGPNTLTASTTGVTPVTFTANGLTLPASISISPGISAVAKGAVNFLALDGANARQDIIWKVNGIVGGSARLGTIAGGVYITPDTIPDGDSVVVTAVLSADTALKSSATVFFLPDNSTRDYVVSFPSVVDAAHPVPMRFIVVPSLDVSSVNFVPVSGASIPLTKIGNGAFTFTVDPSLAGYQTGTLHQFVGRLDYRTSANVQTKTSNLTVNVRDAGMPNVPITSLGLDAQRSPYLLNLRVDAATVYPDGVIVSRALKLLGDRFDFVSVIATVSTNNPPSNYLVRNDVAGIGRALDDSTARWGSAGRLRAAIGYPIPSSFDPADAGSIHVWGHTWINFGTDPLVSPAGPHWPPSTMAQGVMGVTFSPGPGFVEFPWQITPFGNGDVRLQRSTASHLYTPLDLYLMGLLPPDQVPVNYILPASTTPTSLTDGAIMPATTYTIDDYIRRMGPRAPSNATAPHDFSTAIVVLSYGRLLSPAEMAFFDYASSRAETRTSLTSLTGIALSDAPGFFVATGGRATMRTRLP